MLHASRRSSCIAYAFIVCITTHWYTVTAQKSATPKTQEHKQEKSSTPITYTATVETPLYTLGVKRTYTEQEFLIRAAFGTPQDTLEAVKKDIHNAEQSGDFAALILAHLQAAQCYTALYDGQEIAKILQCAAPKNLPALTSVAQKGSHNNVLDDDTMDKLIPRLQSMLATVQKKVIMVNIETPCAHKES